MNQPQALRTRRFCSLMLALATGAISVSVPSFAQVPSDYPSKPIRMIVPFAPSGGTDLTARLVADGLRAELGQSVVMENRPGATGTIGTALAMQAPPDGYTLLFTTSTNQVIAPLLMAKPPYDGARDFTPITLLIRYVGVLLASNSVPGTTMADLIAYAKQRPGKLNYASSGVGSANHLLGEYLKNRTGMDLVHVPYKGSAAGVQALAVDEVQVFFDTIPSSQGWIRQGKVKLVAIASHPRTNLLPGIPTLVELGIFESSSNYWMGLMAPPNMPLPLVTRIHSATAKMMASPEMSAFAAKGGGETAVGTPAEFTALIIAEQRRAAEVIRRNNIRAE
jgi:tripartite-type tricarboxylate transporter receptor subunit TctC